MLCRCEKMQIGATKIPKNIRSMITALRFFAEHKEATTNDLANYIKKDYTTAMRVLKKLEERKLLRLAWQESTPARGKRRYYYAITLNGLTSYANMFKTIPNIREIAKNHSDILLFKKWPKFVEGNCEADVVTSLKREAENATLANYVIIPHISGKVLAPEIEDKSKITFTAMVLGFFYLTKPVEYVKEALGNQWASIERIMRVVQSDYELRSVREEVLHKEEMECSETIRGIAEWREYLKQL